MLKRIALAVAGLLVVIGVLGGLKAIQIGDLIAAGEAMQPPPTTVSSAEVVDDEWEVTLDAIGTLEAAQGVLVTADVPGRVTELHFDGGEQVARGDRLVTLDSSTERAQLRAAEADRRLAQSNLDRTQRLLDSRAVSRADFDSAEAQLAAADAQVENIRSSLDKKEVNAPFDGQLGLRLVDVGQDLGQGVAITSLQAIDPMRVNFSLQQQALARVRTGFPVRITTDAVPDTVFDGEVIAIDTRIDDVTRTVRMQAEIENTNGDDDTPSLLPGMFANVEVVLPNPRPVLRVPLSAISFATFGDSVFVIEDGENDSKTARQQFVQLGERRGDFVEVLDGVEAGQRVASNGVFKLRNGANVALREDGKPEPSLDPSPDNT